MLINKNGSDLLIILCNFWQLGKQWFHLQWSTQVNII